LIQCRNYAIDLIGACGTFSLAPGRQKPTMAQQLDTMALITRVRRYLMFLSYAPVLFTATAVSFLRVLAYARLLDVTQFGVASKILLVSGLFGIVGHFGTQSLAHRDLPLLHASARHRRAALILMKAVLALSGSAALGLLWASLGPRPFGLRASEMAIAVIHGWFHQVFMTLSIDSKSRLRMREYASMHFLRAGAAAIAGVSVALALQSGTATVLAEAMAFAAPTPRLLLRILRQAGLGFRATLSLAWFGLRAFPWLAGFYLLGSSLVSFASINIDRWMAAATLDKTHFGIYAFASIVLSVAQLAQSVISAGAFPLLARRQAEFGVHHALRLAAWLSLGTLACGLIVALVAAVSIGPLVEAYFAGYAAALPTIFILLPAGVLRVSDFWSSFLVIAGHERLLLVAQLLALSVGLGAWLFVFGWDQVLGTGFAWLALACAGAAHLVGAISAVLLRHR
jgi:O-antigen/teichoic acid export membrane protein